MFPPGSLLWLLKHELRLWWRDLTSQPGGRLIAILISSGLFLLLGLWGLGGLIGSQPATDLQDLPDAALWVAVVLWLILFELSFVQAITLSLVRIFERGDLDLLVSSPLPERVIFASRLLMIVLRQILSFWWVWILFVALTLAIPPLLNSIPVFLLLLINSASLAMLTTLKLVEWMGAKQARAVSQLLSVGLSVALLLVARLASGNGSSALQSWGELFSPDSPLGVNSWIWFPARAALGDLPSLLLNLGISWGLAWWSVEGLHHSFIQGTQHSLTTNRSSSPTPAPEIRFRAQLFFLVISKEWRLILRNPYLLSQIGLQLFSCVLLLFVIPGAGLLAWIDLAHLLAAVTCVISYLLVSALASICISGEEAMDLLRSAPVARVRLQRLKLLSILIPVWMLFLGVLGVLALRGIDWQIALWVNLGSTISAALLGLWNAQPRPLGDLATRQKAPDADLVLSVLSFLCPYTWSAAAILSSFDLWGAILPLLMGSLLVGLGYLRSQQLGTT